VRGADGMHSSNCPCPGKNSILKRPLSFAEIWPERFRVACHASFVWNPASVSSCSGAPTMEISGME